MLTSVRTKRGERRLFREFAERGNVLRQRLWAPAHVWLVYSQAFDVAQPSDICRSPFFCLIGEARFRRSALFEAQILLTAAVSLSKWAPAPETG